MANSNKDDTGAFYLVFGAPFVAYTYYRIFSRQNTLILKKNIRQLKKASEVELYVNTTNNLIDSQGIFILSDF